MVIIIKVHDSYVLYSVVIQWIDIKKKRTKKKSTRKKVPGKKVLEEKYREKSILIHMYKQQNTSNKNNI